MHFVKSYIYTQYSAWKKAITSHLHDYEHIATLLATESYRKHRILDKN